MNHHLQSSEVDELAQLLPAPPERDLPADRGQALKEHLMSEFRTLDATGSRPNPARARPRMRRIPALAAGAGVLAAAVTAAFVIPGAGRPPGHVSHDSGAAVLLAKIADVTSRQLGPVVHDGQYEYINSVVAVRRSLDTVTNQLQRWRDYRPPTGPLVYLHVRTWRPADNICREGLTRTTPPPRGSGPDSYFTARGSVKCPSTGFLNDPTYRLLRTLPTSPRRLLHLIYTVERGHGPGPAQEAFATIGGLIGDSIVPPDVSAALYRAAALIPGVTVVRDAANALGRHGIAVALTSNRRPHVIQEWIFDRATLQLIGDATITDGKVVATSAILSHAFVDHLGELPPARS